MSLLRPDAVAITLSDEKGAVDRLVNLLKFRTASNSDMQESHAQDPEQFRLAHKHLHKSYPSVWKQLNVEVVWNLCTVSCPVLASQSMSLTHQFAAQIAEHSLLIQWQGRDMSLKPVLFVSHMDVVPATEGVSSEWSRPPFGGEIFDKWGASQQSNLYL